MFRIFIVSILIMASCGASPEILNEEEKKAIIRDIEETLQNYSNDIRKLGLEAEFKYLDSSSDFSWVPPGYGSAIAFDSVAVILKQNMHLFQSVNNVYESLKIVPLGKHVASYSAIVISSIIDTTEKASTTSLIETGILVKRSAGWKLLNGHTTLIPVPKN